MGKLNAGLRPHKTLHLKTYDLLVSTNRNTDGRGYEQLEAALDRLSGTRKKTNESGGYQGGFRRELRPRKTIVLFPPVPSRSLPYIWPCRDPESSA